MQFLEVGEAQGSVGQAQLRIHQAPLASMTSTLIGSTKTARRRSLHQCDGQMVYGDMASCAQAEKV